MGEKIKLHIECGNMSTIFKMILFLDISILIKYFQNNNLVKIFKYDSLTNLFGFLPFHDLYPSDLDYMLAWRKNDKIKEAKNLNIILSIPMFWGK